MPDPRAVIVVAQSARALAVSARRAGFAPLAIDVFGDEDTRKVSLAMITLEGGLSSGLRAIAVADAVEALIRGYGPVGLVYGSGFEHHAELIAALARMTRVFGNDARTLARAKDPIVFAQICAGAGVPHPQIALRRPDEPEGWLMKRRGGAGGAHIQAATRDGEVPPDAYFQHRVKGQSISASFVADGTHESIVGLSGQWTAPTPRTPFRYGGAVGPIDLDAERTEDIERAVRRLSREFGLVGLNSADFLVSDDAAWLIEINPRPGATLDVFDSDQDPLLAIHLAACDGRMSTPAARTAPKAAQLVYASCDATLQFQSSLPDWIADRPARGTRIKAGDPLCTVLASAGSAEAARRLAGERAGQINALFQINSIFRESAR